MTATVSEARPRRRPCPRVDWRWLADVQRNRLRPLIDELRNRGYRAELKALRDPLRFALLVPHPRPSEVPTEDRRWSTLWIWCRLGADRVWRFEYPWGDALAATADVPGTADYIAELLGPPGPDGGDR